MGFSQVFGSEIEQECESKIEKVVKEMSNKLKDRAAIEIQALPFESVDQAQALIDARNSRNSLAGGSVSLSSFDNDVPGMGDPSGGPSSSPGAISERIERAEKFVQQQIKPALKRAQEAELADLVRGTGSYLKGLWDRLNGGGKQASSKASIVDLGLPLPPNSRKDSELAIGQLSLDLDLLEKKLQESKLRKAGIPGRVRMAVQLKRMDADVIALSRLLAVRTLQLEMEYIYRSLEDEALDLSGYYDSVGDDVMAFVEREGATSELHLLVADFILLEEQLSALSVALGSDASSSASSSSSSSNGNGHSNGSVRDVDGTIAVFGSLSLVGEELLESLAVEIPDMRVRVGVVDQVVFGGQGFSLTRVQLQLKESLDKVKEGVSFLVRGVRLLGSDVAISSRIFARAVLGGTLKPREVSALRRTTRDVLAFIPFTIILIIPLSPLGHVLVFGFIQTYFPSW